MPLSALRSRDKKYKRFGNFRDPRRTVAQVYAHLLLLFPTHNFFCLFVFHIHPLTLGLSRLLSPSPW